MYRWTKERGIDENEILDVLPEVLRSDIMIKKNIDVLMESNLFRSSPDKIHPQIVSSFFKICKFAHYHANDYIITIRTI